MRHRRRERIDINQPSFYRATQHHHSSFGATRGLPTLRGRRGGTQVARPGSPRCVLILRPILAAHSGRTRCTCFMKAAPGLPSVSRTDPALHCSNQLAPPHVLGSCTVTYHARNEQ
jgi:hypothetical protein